VEKVEAVIARQFSKHISAAIYQHVTAGDLLEPVFSEWSAPKLHSEGPMGKVSK
jgi:hypothetical protein